MVTGRELTQIMSRLGLSAQARAVIENARSRSTQRLRRDIRSFSRVQPGTKIVFGIRLGNYDAELPPILDLEYDPDVVAYWHRPDPLTLSITSADGSRHSVLHTPLCLVVRRGGVAYEDWATEEDLRKGEGEGMLAGRSTRTVDGRWRCPPAEARAAATGLGYIQHSYAEISPCVQANADYLATYLRADRRWPDLDNEWAATLVKVVRRTPGISVHDLGLEVGNRVGAAIARPGRLADAITLLIVQRRLYVNLREERLCEPAQAHLYTDEATAQAFTLVARSSGPAPGALSPCGITAAGRELLLKARREDLALANERYKALSPLVAGTSRPSQAACDLPRSTRFRLIRQYQEAARSYSSGYIGLLPAYANCGRRGPRHNERTVTLVEKHVAEYHDSPCRPTKRAAYDKLRAACKQEGVACPSYTYFSGKLSA